MKKATIMGNSLNLCGLMVNHKGPMQISQGMGGSLTHSQDLSGAFGRAPRQAV